MLLVLALIFAAVAVLSGALGFRGLSSAASSIARAFLLVFLVLFVLFLILYLL